MPKKLWKSWSLKVGDGTVERMQDGNVGFMSPTLETVFLLAPSEARNLFKKLSGDYRD